MDVIDPSDVIDGLAAAWAAGDADAYAALFTDDADYVAFDGTRMVGARQIADGHRALFAGIMRGSRMTHREPGVRHLTDDVAVVCTIGGIVMRWQRGPEPSGKRLSTVTYVLVRDGERWRAAAFQNTRYRPWARTLVGRVLTKLDRAQ
ncbi:SgcJ/EcaC family oxidoreductase [Nocardioides sp. YIM 152315]|uniref:SgcJ/EcaC family oxidoreductase n=1 Tax=Nocardioides sp. YIM 152315 TaxID=3031760 RepID=UPI0023DA23A5|nr:SgcJ/EcaC family oxidoreductase [Nocardioides sp. YIM 152315]MDF1602471.1 SgcJ/EcaC family oxidoreductase [Nocardioides sp. YIM 152315]